MSLWQLSGVSLVQLSRRTFLAAAFSGTAVATAGCLGSGTNETADEQSPEEARIQIKAIVNLYYDSIDEGDADQFLSLVHPDSIEETFNPTPMFGRFSVEVDTLTVVELDQNEEVATVESAVQAVSTDESESREERLELRVYEGVWHIWLEDPDPFDVG